MTVRVAVPEPVTLCGLRPRVIPVPKDELVSATVPVNPFSAETLMVEVEDWPAVIVRAEGVAEMLKSGPITSTPTDVVWIIDGEVLVPLTGTL